MLTYVLTLQQHHVQQQKYLYQVKYFVIITNQQSFILNDAGGAVTLKSNSQGVFLDPITQPSASKKWKYHRCGIPMYLLLSTSLAPEDYVQVNRDVYKGVTCVPKLILMSSDRQYPLIGLVAANETSTFKAFYICPCKLGPFI